MTFAGLMGIAAVAWIIRAPTPAPVPGFGVTMTDVTIINPGRPHRPGSTIVVEGATISRITTRPPAEPPTGPGQWSGRYVLPGLIDMHVHHPSRMAPGHAELFALMFLAHGVTTVRDAGNFDGLIWDLKARIDTARIPGPRIHAAGPIMDGPNPTWPGSIRIARPEDVEPAVQDLVHDGASFLKIYNGFPPGAIPELQKVAEKHRLRIVGHMPRGASLETCQIDDVQHLSGVPDYSKIPPEATHGRSVSAWLALDRARIDHVVRASREHLQTHTPTLVLYHRLARLVQYPQDAGDPWVKRLPRVFPDILWNPALDPRYRHIRTPDWISYTDVAARTQEVVGHLHRAGIPIHAGTDTPNPFVIPGKSLHEELGHLVAAGLTVEEAWIAATQRPGAWLESSGLGTLRPGAPADLLIFREDPTVDLAALNTLEAIVAGGRLYRREDLLAEIGRYAARFHSTLYDRVTVWGARIAFPLYFLLP